MTFPLGLVAPPTLRSIHLSQIIPQTTELRLRDVKSLLPTSTGRRREQRAWYGQQALDNPSSIMPSQRILHQVTLLYRHLRGTSLDTVEELLSLEGPHSLCVWKALHLAWKGDGTKVEGFLPWQLAVDVIGSVPPNGPAAVEYQPVVKLATVDANGVPTYSVPFTFVLKTQGDYDAGAPTASEVWFVDQGQTFKIETAPTTSEFLSVRFVPLLQMFEGSEVDKQYTGDAPGREPRGIVLLEATA